MKHYLLGLILVCFSSTVFAHGILIYGHRGARGLSPENTIPAYQTALAIGVNFVDMDINMTKDGVLVVTHDSWLNPDLTRDKSGHWIAPKKKILVKDLTLKQLESYTVGEIKPGSNYAKVFPQQYPVAKTHIPTLKQVIDYVKQHSQYKVGFQIEIKTDPHFPNNTFSPKKLAAALAKLLKQEHIVGRSQIQAFDWRCLLALQKINPAIKTAYLTEADEVPQFQSNNPQVAGIWTAGYLLKDYDNSIPKMVKALGGTYWDPQDSQLTQEQVKQAHALGLKVIVWSWPQHPGQQFVPQEIEKMIAFKVDGIITDRPDRLRGLLAARQLITPLKKA